MEAAESVLRAGYRLDRYELLCPIASGGMATVWLSRLRGKRGFEKLFAIKTIRTELVDDPRFQEMFLDEARIASGIQHPNVAQILDLGEQEDVLFIVMEWVDGDALAKIRRLIAKRGGKLPVGVVLRVLADACAGLHAAHELRDERGEPIDIVHRDVSPQNILISTGGAVKVIDFGIAKAQGRRQGETRTGVVKGKIQYMAPEQVKKGRSVDRRADVWSLGVCLQELLTGKLPYDGDDDVEVIRKLMTDEAPPPAEGLPGPLVQVLAKSVVLDPDARFPTAAGMQRAIEGAMKELGESATSEDVAAFIRTELPDLAQKRREVVTKAVDEARDRPAVSLSDAKDEVAFAPTVMSERQPAGVGGAAATSPAPSGTRRTRDSEAGTIALVKKKEPHATNASVALDQEPIKIPKTSKAWLWVTLVVLLGGAGVWYQYPEQVKHFFASIGIGGGAPPEPASTAQATPPPPPVAPATTESSAASAPTRASVVAPASPPSVPSASARPEPSASHHLGWPVLPPGPAHPAASAAPHPSASAVAPPSAVPVPPPPPEDDPSNPYKPDPPASSGL
ncbi:MAG TPA: protein kinase [Polyangiaceae bacterium]